MTYFCSSTPDPGGIEMDSLVLLISLTPKMYESVTHESVTHESVAHESVAHESVTHESVTHT